MNAAALFWAVPAVLALALVLAVLPPQHARTALRCALGLWIAVIVALIARS